MRKGGDKVVPVKGMMTREIPTPVLGTTRLGDPSPQAIFSLESRTEHTTKLNLDLSSVPVQLLTWRRAQAVYADCLCEITYQCAQLQRVSVLSLICTQVQKVCMQLLTCIQMLVPLCSHSCVQVLTDIVWLHALAQVQSLCQPLPECRCWLCLCAFLPFLLWLFGLVSSKESRALGALSGFLCWYLCVAYPLTLWAR